MFVIWPFFLPAKIAFGTLLTLLVIATVFAQKRRRWGGRVFSIGVIVAGLLFFPCALLIQKVTNPLQLGVFHYPGPESVWGPFAGIFHPETATDLAIDNQPAGYTAKFRITKQEVEQWVEHQWATRGNKSEYPRGSSESPHYFDRDRMEEITEKLGWKVPADAIAYDGPFWQSGCGSTIYYSETEGMAYQFAAYW